MSALVLSKLMLILVTSYKLILMFSLGQNFMDSLTMVHHIEIFMNSILIGLNIHHNVCCLSF